MERTEGSLNLWMSWHICQIRNPLAMPIIYGGYSINRNYARLWGQLPPGTGSRNVYVGKAVRAEIADNRC